LRGSNSSKEKFGFVKLAENPLCLPTGRPAGGESKVPIPKRSPPLIKGLAVGVGDERAGYMPMLLLLLWTGDLWASRGGRAGGGETRNGGCC